MPEGHTIHGIAGRMARAFAGEELQVSSPQGRFASEAALLDGRALVGTEAAGKHLFLRFEGEAVVHVHLGLIGRFSVVPDPATPVTGVVRLRLHSDTHTADLRGPNLCELTTPAAIDDVLARLGPDPLRPDADPDRAWARITKSRKGIGELLMDQAVVAGVGNVYRCEVLWRHRLDPMTPGSRLRKQQWDALWADIVRLLRVGVVFNQIITMEDQVLAAEAMIERGEHAPIEAALTGEGLGGHFVRRFHLYQRTGEPCTACGTPVAARQVAGRTLYWCPACQS